ncbi:MAG: hypothetical protein V3U92_13785 [Cellulophaga sp.]
MKIQITAIYILAFLALTFVMHEAHEIVHTSIGRLICGCWGERDFNTWELGKNCSVQHPFSMIATFAGPIFTYLMIWIGYAMLKSSNSGKLKSLGFSLIFANLPFGRILTASLGGGDEVFGLNKLLYNHPLAWGIGLFLVLLLTIVPLYKAFLCIENKKRVGLFLLFFVAPLLIDILIVLVFLNTLLAKGILSDYWVLGSPILVTVWTVLVIIVFIRTKKNLYSL